MSTPAQSPSGKQGKTVLVVDDNPFIRKAVCMELTSLGFGACVEAEDGADALREACKSLNPDLIILDLSMPIMGGLEAAPLLHQLLPVQLPSFLYTLYGSLLSGAGLSRIGITEVVSKDEPLERLISRAQSLIEGT